MLFDYIKALMNSALFNPKSRLEQYLDNCNPQNNEELEYYIRQYDAKNYNSWWI